jgi:hypothetical protein
MLGIVHQIKVQEIRYVLVCKDSESADFLSVESGVKK